MMPRKPDIDPSANAETADATGMWKARTRDEQRGDDRVERRVRGGDAEVPDAVLVAVRMQRDEVEERQDGDRGDEGREEDVAERVVVLKIHSNLPLRDANGDAARNEGTPEARCWRAESIPPAVGAHGPETPADASLPSPRTPRREGGYRSRAVITVCSPEIEPLEASDAESDAADTEVLDAGLTRLL